MNVLAPLVVAFGAGHLVVIAASTLAAALSGPSEKSGLASDFSSVRQLSDRASTLVFPGLGAILAGWFISLSSSAVFDIISNDRIADNTTTTLVFLPLFIGVLLALGALIPVFHIVSNLDLLGGSTRNIVLAARERSSNSSSSGVSVSEIETAIVRWAMSDVTGARANRLVASARRLKRASDSEVERAIIRFAAGGPSWENEEAAKRLRKLRRDGLPWHRKLQLSWHAYWAQVRSGAKMEGVILVPVLISAALVALVTTVEIFTAYQFSEGSLSVVLVVLALQVLGVVIFQVPARIIYQARWFVWNEQNLTEASQLLRRMRRRRHWGRTRRMRQVIRGSTDRSSWSLRSRQGR